MGPTDSEKPTTMAAITRGGRRMLLRVTNMLSGDRGQNPVNPKSIASAQTERSGTLTTFEATLPAQGGIPASL